MRAPPLLLLQVFNALIGFTCLLIATTSITVWTAAGWKWAAVGLAMTTVNLAYGGLVAQGGRLAESWGRARTSTLGCMICAVGCGLGLAFPTPLVLVVASTLVFAGGAVFFPGSAGLFSDAAGSTGQTPALNVKVSRYNLGWAWGNLAGFAGSGLIARLPQRAADAIALSASLIVGLVLWRWRALPNRPPVSTGDRGGHPALARLTMMGRCSLFFACVVGMGLISLLENALSIAGTPSGAGLARTAAMTAASLSSGHVTAMTALTAYACGYVTMFMILGRWGGWVLAPWRLWALQCLMLLGAVGIALAPALGLSGRGPMAGFSLLIGLGYGAVYTGSIYYSLRLPQGASRAAGLHETFLGVGNTVGPLVTGLFLVLWSRLGQGTEPALAGLGTFLVIGVLICLLFQAVLIPGMPLRS